MYGSNNFKKAVSSLVESFNKEGRPFGQLLSDAVKNSVNTLLLIGGLIILFSVIIRLITISGFANIVTNILYIILRPFQVDKTLLSPAVSGLFEITIGAKLISSAHAALPQKIIAVSGIIAWSGFSIHAQVAGVLSSTDLKLGTYILTKILHSAATCIYAYFIINMWGIRDTFEIPVFLQGMINDANQGWAAKLALSTGRYVYIILLIFVFSFIYKMVSKLYYAFRH
jgi:nucleoside recognition membrane protein YjiH